MSTRAKSAPNDAKAFVEAHQDGASAEVFGIRDLAGQFGISPRAIRFYESKGLLSPRRVNGARIYSRRDRARLALITRAKALGTSLSEIKHYLELYGQHGEGRPKQLAYVVEKSDLAISELETKKQQIDKTLEELRLINRVSKRKLGEH